MAGTLGLLVVSLVCFQRPIRVDYHKWRLQALKEKRDRYMGAKLSRGEKLWLKVTGRPTSVESLANAIRHHEDALVRFGFLHRKNFEMHTETASNAGDVLATLRCECPWYHAEIIGQNHLVVVTACPKMMEDWGKRAHRSGWKEFPSTHL
jgi:hypothetical protein